MSKNIPAITARKEGHIFIDDKTEKVIGITLDFKNENPNGKSMAVFLDIFNKKKSFLIRSGRTDIRVYVKK